jgi:hypothetical protein
VTPCYQNYLLPYLKEADFIFNNDHQADLEFERLLAVLTPKISCLSD